MKKKNFLISISDKEFRNCLRLTTEQLRCKPDSFLRGFTSSKKDGWFATLDVYASSEPDECPYTQLTVWKSGDEYMSDIIDLSADDNALTLSYDRSVSGELYKFPFTVKIIVA